MTQEPEQGNAVRRYIAVIQDPRGYPAPGAPLELAPPVGPSPPVIHSVVLADDYERVESERDDARAEVRRLLEQYEAESLEAP